VWITSAGAVEADIARGLLVPLPLAAGPSQEPLGLMLAADAAPGPALQALADLVRQQAARRRDRSSH
jgi:DNA-binding transcriptional LysR family regulator